MLIYFAVKNFKSFKDEVVLNMKAECKSHPEHLLRYGKDKKILPVAALYGANASGKTNLIKAVEYVRDLVLEGTKSGNKIARFPFALSSDLGTVPTSVEIGFVKGEIEYEYSFSFTSERIFDECLKGNPNGRKTVLFSTEDGKIKLESSFTGNLKLTSLVTLKRDNQLFLTDAIEREIDELLSVGEWFRQLKFIYPNSAFIDIHQLFDKDSLFKSLLKIIFSFSDVGIADVDVKTEKLNLENDTKKKLEELLAKEPQLPVDDFKLLSKDEEGNIVSTTFSTLHSKENGEKIPFEFKDESSGTQRLVNLAPLLHFDFIYFIDELESSLHPLLAKAIILLFLKKHRGQMIFTTHDVNLLDSELLRHDEIWFVEKDKTGASHIASLVEYNVRNDLKLDKGYLNGRFGAIPFLDDVNSVSKLLNKEA